MGSNGNGESQWQEFLRENPEETDEMKKEAVKKKFSYGRILIVSSVVATIVLSIFVDAWWLFVGILVSILITVIVGLFF